jgi:hypothetical protein
MQKGRRVSGGIRVVAWAVRLIWMAARLGQSPFVAAEGPPPAQAEEEEVGREEGGCGCG